MDGEASRKRGGGGGGGIKKLGPAIKMPNLYSQGTNNPTQFKQTAITTNECLATAYTSHLGP